MIDFAKKKCFGLLLVITKKKSSPQKCLKSIRPTTKDPKSQNHKKKIHYQESHCAWFKKYFFELTLACF